MYCERPCLDALVLLCRRRSRLAPWLTDITDCRNTNKKERYGRSSRDGTVVAAAQHTPPRTTFALCRSVTKQPLQTLQISTAAADVIAFEAAASGSRREQFVARG